MTQFARPLNLFSLVAMASSEIEKKVFDQFITINPMFAGRPVKWSLGANPPDVLCIDSDAQRIGVEMSEWVDEGQIAREKPQYQREEAFLKVIDSKSVPPPKNIGGVTFFEQEGVRLSPSDAEQFRKELYAFIIELDDHWQTLDGYDERPGVDLENEDFVAHPTLAMYTHSLGCVSRQYEPSQRGDEWIGFMSHGGAYSPDTALDAAIIALRKKTNMYATLEADESLDELYLLLYYDQGWAHNTPFISPTFGFAQIAEGLRAVAAGDHGQFERIFVFIPATKEIADIYP